MSAERTSEQTLIKEVLRMRKLKINRKKEKE